MTCKIIACNYFVYIQEICDTVENIRDKHEKCVSEQVWQTMKQTKHILEGNEVCISVLGLHNTGKSTFLNALLGD